MREVPGSNPGQAQPSSFSLSAVSYLPGLLIFFDFFFHFFALSLKGGLEERGVPSIFIQWVIKRWVAGQSASIAQWQSTGLVNQGSRVQSSLEA